MKPLTLEIHGASALNRGSELTAIAIAEHVRVRYPTARIVVPPSFGGFSARAHHNFLTTWEMVTGVRTKTIFRFAPRPLKRSAGMVDPREVDVVLDASDLSLSDHVGAKPGLQLLKKMNRRDRKHQTLILLPQALGPFSEPAVANVARRVMERAALICARDDASFSAAASLVERSKLRRFPDVSINASSNFPSEFEFPPHYSVIVPSAQVLDRCKQPREHLAFLTHAVDALRRLRLNPVIILHHDSADARVIDGLSGLAPDVPVWEHRDPCALKAMIGRATLIVGSRYHALLNGLIQGVPCIAAGASHHFSELLKDFDCEDLVVEDAVDIGSLEQKLRLLSTSAQRAERTERIRARAARMKPQFKEMWLEVESFLNGANDR
jgi:polysaccharide pyruvyl transferase WcaK-like protein